MYQGNVEGAKEYFDRMGYPCPANINPADHYMDVVGGVVKKNGTQTDSKVLCDEWNNQVNAINNNATLNEEGEDTDNHRASPGMKI